MCHVAAIASVSTSGRVPSNTTTRCFSRRSPGSNDAMRSSIESSRCTPMTCLDHLGRLHLRIVRVPRLGRRADVLTADLNRDDGVRRGARPGTSRARGRLSSGLAPAFTDACVQGWRGWARPTGTVTFLFTDVVGSTAAWEADPQRMAEALAVHDQVLRSVVDAHGGYVFATGGDGYAVAFQRADDAILGRCGRSAGSARRSGRTVRRCRCGWEPTAATRSSATVTTSVRRSTGRLGSWTQPTVVSSS